MRARQTGPYLFEKIVTRHITAVVEDEQGEERAGLLAPLALAQIALANGHLETTKQAHVHLITGLVDDVGLGGSLSGILHREPLKLPRYRCGLSTTAGGEHFEHVSSSVENLGVATVHDGTDQPKVP